MSETTGRARTLVVPLSPGDDAAVVTAKYDLGLVDQAQAVDNGPAQWADPSELTPELVFEAYGLALFGSARRAWEQLAGADVCRSSTIPVRSTGWARRGPRLGSRSGLGSSRRALRSVGGTAGGGDPYDNDDKGVDEA